VLKNGCANCSRSSASNKRTVTSGGSGGTTTAVLGPPRSAPGKGSGGAAPAIPRPSKTAPSKSSGSAVPAVVGPSPASVTPVVPVTILRRPTYASTDESRVMMSYASIGAKGASPDGYNLVEGRKRFAKKKAISLEVITSIPVMSRHSTVRVQRARDEKCILPC